MTHIPTVMTKISYNHRIQSWSSYSCKKSLFIICTEATNILPIFNFVHFFRGRKEHIYKIDTCMLFCSFHQNLSENWTEAAPCHFQSVKFWQKNSILKRKNYTERWYLKDVGKCISSPHTDSGILNIIASPLPFSYLFYISVKGCSIRLGRLSILIILKWAQDYRYSLHWLNLGKKYFEGLFAFKIDSKF